MLDARRAPAQIKPDPELVFAMSSDPGHLDPRVEAGTPGFALLAHIHDAAVWHQPHPVARHEVGTGGPERPALASAQGREVPQREAVGFKVTFENPVWSTFAAEIVKYERAKYDGYMFGWGITSGEPDQALGDHFHSGAPKRTMYRNPEVDRYIAEERESFDEAKVKAALLKAQELIWDDAPWMFLYENPEVNAINRRLQWTGGCRDEYPMFTGASILA
jgi:hypothetical protein